MEGRAGLVSTAKRPLGIPTILDRLIQQCVLQVLEPICEAKFHEHSYGFRPNRSQEHAIALVYKNIQVSHYYFVVDIDIKGFFDNVSHGKLLKQMWALGIRDKKLLSIVSAMLKAEVAGIGFPEKGTPQGGIISPLLSNIVLNELDWWIASQWEEMPTKRTYATYKNPNGSDQKSAKYLSLRNCTRLKEVTCVRYADDFKLFTKSYKQARKLFYAVEGWLKDRLGLDISPEKSKIVNLKESYSEFLGLRIRAMEVKIPDYIKERYGDSRQLRFVNGYALAPIGYVQKRNPMMKRRNTNDYTPEGRKAIHAELGKNIDKSVMHYLMRNPIPYRSTAFNDNRISLYCAQFGKCAVSGEKLKIGDIYCHHKVPKHLGGTDEYKNLVIVSEAVHRLIHSTNPATIRKYLETLNLDAKQLKKLDKFRSLAKVESYLKCAAI